jgi:hypothetical protein
MDKVDHNFISGCLQAIADMRGAGINDTLIACILSDVRAAAIREERMRVEVLIRDNPPVYLPSRAYADAIKPTREEQDQ